MHSELRRGPTIEHPANNKRLISTESHDSSLIAATLADLARKGADAAQIAGAIVSTWQVIDAALSPIIGHGGIAALYMRSLYLTSHAYPWMASAHGGVETAMNLAALKSVLVQQGSADAAAGGGALLQTFRELLVGLVGPSLTEQLLRSVGENFLSAQSAQDTSP